jgi:hypothetical protein
VNDESKTQFHGMLKDQELPAFGRVDLSFGMHVLGNSSV